jgi:phosphatidylserine decarboxylase
MLSIGLGILLSLLTTLPLSWKWRLSLPRIGTFTILLAGSAGIVLSLVERMAHLSVLAHAALIWLVSVVGSVGVLVYRFYRDPERSPITTDDVIVSPADGEVVYVYESQRGLLPVSNKHGRPYELIELTKSALEVGEAVVIGISMSFLDVHINRAPLSGRVVSRHHFHGTFGSLRRREMLFENERATTILQGNSLQVAVVQIASRLVRRITSFVEEGQEVKLGERIGAIQFGSQVDLVLPSRNEVRIIVRRGDRLKAGESVIAHLEDSRSRLSGDTVETSELL